MGYTLILAIVVFSFRLYMISSKEVFDNALFTDYFQVDEAGNGGLELTTSNFTTFEKDYNFVRICLIVLVILIISLTLGVKHN